MYITKRTEILDGDKPLVAEFDVVFPDFPASIYNQLFFCQECGKVWGRVTYLTSPWRLTWQAIHSHCAKCGEGIILFPAIATKDYLCNFPAEFLINQGERYLACTQYIDFPRSLS